MEEKQYFNQNEPTEIVWLDKTDITLLCRICANSSEYLLSIFEGEGLENELDMKIAKHLPIIKVTKDDSLPTSVCYQCASTLIAWHDLTINCIEADKRLHGLAENVCKEESKVIGDNCEGIQCINGSSDCDQEVMTIADTTVEGDQLDTDNSVSNIVNTDKIEKQKKKKQNLVQENISKNRYYAEPDDYSLLESSVGREANIEGESPNVPKKKRKKTFCECSVCGKKFNYTNNLRVHMASHSNERPFVCEVCGETYKRKDHLRHHLKAAHASLPQIGGNIGYKQPLKKWVCNICGNIFKSKLSLSDHLRRHNGEKPFQCFTCGKCFPAPSGLRNHRVRKCAIPDHLNTKDVKHTCNICDEVFISYRAFYTHKYKHSMPFICDICGKCFALNTQLKSHQITHSDERPFECNVCSKSFKTKSILQSHHKMHSDERPYPCPHCSWKCRKKADLIVHIRTHTKEKPYACCICGKGFSQAGDMRKHKSTHNFVKG